MATIRRIAMICVVFVCAFFSSYAQERELRIYYPFDNATVRADYLGNDRTFQQLDSLVAAGALNGRDSIEVVSYSSPEGNYAYNLALSRRRAEAFRKYLTATYPQLDGRITINPGAESWDDLRAAIMNDVRMDETVRETMLNIVDSPAAPDVKEARLRTVPQYKQFYASYFKRFRYAFIRVKEAEASLQTEILPAEPDTIKVHPGDTLSIPGHVIIGVHDTVQTVRTDTVTIVRTDTVYITKTPVIYRPKTTVVALKTNLLYDAVTALNFEVEVPIANRFSIMAEDVFPWWETGNKYCFQMWEMGIEGRVWLKPWDPKGTEKLRGWFGGLYGMSSKYDFQYDRSLNYQGEYWSAGLTAGYAMPIGRKKRVNLEFSLSLGYLQSDYRHYQPTGDYDKLIRDKYNIGKVSYFGPTKAKVSLVVPINIPGKKEVRYE